MADPGARVTSVSCLCIRRYLQHCAGCVCPVSSGRAQQFRLVFEQWREKTVLLVCEGLGKCPFNVRFSGAEIYLLVYIRKSGVPQSLAVPQSLRGLEQSHLPLSGSAFPQAARGCKLKCCSSFSPIISAQRISLGAAEASLSLGNSGNQKPSRLLWNFALADRQCFVCFKLAVNLVFNFHGAHCAHNSSKVPGNGERRLIEYA
jgi:hypothetical protein